MLSLDDIDSRITISDNGCHKWAGSHTVDGRARIQINGKTYYIYRLQYARRHGAISSDLHIHHVCHNGWCVNVDHLQEMTAAAHIQIHRAATRVDPPDQCKHGHANAWRFNAQGNWVCNQCNREACARSYRKRVARRESLV